MKIYAKVKNETKYVEDLIFSVFFRLFGILDQSVKYLFYKETILTEFDYFTDILGELNDENLISCYKKIESLRENTTVLSDGIERKVSYSIRQLWNFLKHEHAIVITSSTDSKEEIEKFQNRGVCDDVVSKIFIPLRNLIEYWVSLI